MLRKIILLALLACSCAGLAVAQDVVVAQISDLHLGLKKSPKTGQPLDPAAKLRRVVEMVNARRPDVVIVSGDVGENSAAWREARGILAGLKAPVRYLPGNHDENGRNLDRWRSEFGDSYYTFRVRHALFYMIDSQLLGNYDDFHTRAPQPLAPEARSEAERMLAWLSNEEQREARGGDGDDATVRIAVQHVPFSSAEAPDSKPYWTTQEPWRSRERDLLRRLGVRHALEGHWHKAVVFESDGFTHHIAPAVSWATEGATGFAMHRIKPQGEVRTEFVNLD